MQVLAVAAALLLVFGGLMLGLYLNERGNLNDTKSNLRDTRADLSAQVQEQKTLNAQQQEKLTASEKRADDLNTQLSTTKTNLANVTGERDAVVPCMRRIQDAFDAAADGSVTGVNNALRDGVRQGRDQGRLLSRSPVGGLGAPTRRGLPSTAAAEDLKGHRQSRGA